MNQSFVNDPRWREISASLRSGHLYIKMPISTATLLVSSLAAHAALNSSSSVHGQCAEMGIFLRDQIKQTEKTFLSSIIFSLSEAVARKDLEALLVLESENPETDLKPYLYSLERGLQEDPQVDWIARVGGPPVLRRPLGLDARTIVSETELPELG